MAGITALVNLDTSATPDMTINPMGDTIDFSASPWPVALAAFPDVSNKDRRTRALAAAPAKTRVDVNPDWWKA
jgi:hypothetical protein